MLRKLLIPLVLVGLTTSCGDDETSDSATNGAAQRSDGIPVQIQLIKQSSVIDFVTATGTVFPLHDVLISSQTAGTVTKVNADAGGWVNAGDLLLLVDPELKELALQQAQAKLLEAGAAFDKATKDFERNQRLFDSKDISEYIFETARLQKESAAAARAMAEANVKMAQRQLQDTRISSPVDGFVAARLIELGSTVAPGVPVAKVVDIKQVRVKFGVAERDVAKIARGQSVQVSVDAYPDMPFSGKISAVGPQADLGTRTFPIEVLVDNPASHLKAGMVARVEVAAKTLTDALLLPKSALLERGNESFVFVSKKGVAEKRVPQLGIESGEFVVILAGISAGEEVVVLGQENLVNGSQLIIKN